MTDYDITMIENTPSIMGELDPIFIGRLEKFKPYIFRFILYLLSGCIYVFLIYMMLLVIGGMIYET